MKYSILSKFFLSIILFFITIYRNFISPLKPGCCRFYPSCSLYARDSFTTHGLLKGAYLSLARILKCHPFHPGGFDPVPNHKVRTDEHG